MERVNAEIVSVLFDPNTRSETLVLRLKQSCMSWYGEMKKHGELTVTFEKKKKKRSLLQNDMCWALCDAIAKALRQDGLDVSKDMVYREHIRRAGRFEMLYIRPDAAEDFKKEWEAKPGWGWVCDLRNGAGPNNMTGCVCYYGSSTYNTKEFSDLLNSIILEAEECGLNTKTAR